MSKAINNKTKLNNIYDVVADYGADRTGVSDSTAAIQNAINAAEAAGGGIVKIPQGTYLLSSTLVIDSSNVSLIGEGMWNTILTRSTDYGNTLTITGNDGTGTYVNHIEISKLRFRSTGLTTSGAHINANGISRLTLSDIFMFDGFIGLRMQGVLPAYINNFYVVFVNLYGGSTSGRRYVVFGNAAATYSHPSCADVMVSNFNWTGNVSNQVAEIGCDIISADGLWFSNGRIAWTTTASLRFNASTTEIINLVWFDNFMLDGTNSIGLQFTGSTPSYFGAIRFNNFEFKGATVGALGTVFSTGTTAKDVHFSNGSVWQWTQHGISHQSTASGVVSYNNVHVYDCSLSGVGSFSALNMAAGVSYVQVNGGRFGGTSTLGATGNTNFGINVGAGAGNHITITGADCSFNQTSGISFGATGSSNKITGCKDSVSTTVASAGAVTVPTAHDVVKISGTTNISTVAVRPIGSRITLIFEGALTVNDGAGNLRLNGNFVTTADDTLTLVCDGTNWFEVSRSAN